MFVDEVVINVISGKGGDGIVHFRREKFVPFGGPDGGDGGSGGDVVLRVKSTLNTLVNFRYKQLFRGENGLRGGKNNQTGKSGEDLIISVPPGTMVFDDSIDELIGDMLDSEEALTVCKGGRGGRGNSHFNTSRNQAPRIAERGEPAQERMLRLELKLIADVGIIGVPNAGKSTLLSVVTNAKPKIASYPFTTLHPNLGVAQLDDEITLVLADIPGLIEGAHKGIGLGHEFLRHIQRTRVLIHILDGLADDPLMDFAQINSELSLFDPELSTKPQIVVLNKIDLPDVRSKWVGLSRKLQNRGHEPHKISAVTGEGVRSILFKAYQLLSELPAPKLDESIPVYRVEEDPKDFTITQVSDGWRVSGRAIERAAAMTYWEYDQSILRFQRILGVLGIDAALRDGGIQPHEIVHIGEFELEWSE